MNAASLLLVLALTASSFSAPVDNPVEPVVSTDSETGKLPQDVAEPSPAGAPAPSGQTEEAAKEEEDVSAVTASELEDIKQTETKTERVPEADKAPVEADAEVEKQTSEIVEETSEEPSEVSEANAEAAEEAAEAAEEAAEAAEEAAEEVAEEAVEAAAQDAAADSEATEDSDEETVSEVADQVEADVSDSLREPEGSGGDSVIQLEELNLVSDGDFHQLSDTAELVLEGSASSLIDVIADAPEELIVEGSGADLLADFAASGTSVDEVSPLTEGSGIESDISDKLPLLEVAKAAADDSLADLILGEGSGAAANAPVVQIVEASGVAADDSFTDLVIEEGSGAWASASAPLVRIVEASGIAADDSLADLITGEGSGAAASAPLAKIAEASGAVSDDSGAELRSFNVQAEGSGNSANAPLSLAVEADALDDEGLLDVDQNSDQEGSASAALLSLNSGSGEVGDF